MRPIPANILRLAQRHAPAFVAAVRAAAAAAAAGPLLPQQPQPQSRPQKPGNQAPRATVTTTLSHFGEGDMSLVYACLWYAHTERVAVLFEAPQDHIPLR
jgi:hypothetical protein